MPNRAIIKLTPQLIAAWLENGPENCKQISGIKNLKILAVRAADEWSLSHSSFYNDGIEFLVEADEGIEDRPQGTELSILKLEYRRINPLYPDIGLEEAKKAEKRDNDNA